MSDDLWGSAGRPQRVRNTMKEFEIFSSSPLKNGEMIHKKKKNSSPILFSCIDGIGTSVSILLLLHIVFESYWLCHCIAWRYCYFFSYFFFLSHGMSAFDDIIITFVIILIHLIFSPTMTPTPPFSICLFKRELFSFSINSISTGTERELNIFYS